MESSSSDPLAILVPVPCRRRKAGRWEEIEDHLAREVRLSYRLDGESGRLWACPIDPVPLVRGHCLLERCTPGVVPGPVKVRDAGFDLERMPDERPDPAGRPEAGLPEGALVELMAAFIRAPGLWDGTGCFHRTAAYDPKTGDFVLRAEDIGRHNCIDRLAGSALQQGVDLSACVLFASARITASFYAKAIAAGFRAMVSRSAVTTAAREGALKDGATLIGFARESEERYTVFADAMELVS